MVNRLTLVRLKNKPIEEHIKSIIKKLNSVEMMIVGTALDTSELRDELVKAMDKKGLNGSRMVNRLDKRKEFLDIDRNITQKELKIIIKHLGWILQKLYLISEGL